MLRFGAVFDRFGVVSDRFRLQVKFGNKKNRIVCGVVFDRFGAVFDRFPVGWNLEGCWSSWKSEISNKIPCILSLIVPLKGLMGNATTFCAEFR